MFRLTCYRAEQVSQDTTERAIVLVNLSSCLTIFIQIGVDHSILFNVKTY